MKCPTCESKLEFIEPCCYKSLRRGYGQIDGRAYKCPECRATVISDDNFRPRVIDEGDVPESLTDAFPDVSV